MTAAEEWAEEIQLPEADHRLPRLNFDLPLETVTQRLLHATGVRPIELSRIYKHESGYLALREGRRLWADPDTIAHFQPVENCQDWRYRHRFAVQAIESGADLFVVQALLGHEHLDTTRNYLPACPGLWKPQYQRSHPLLNPLRESEGQAPISVEEVMQLIAAPREPWKSLAIRTLYATALRASELTNLEHTDLYTDRILVRDGKGPQDRYTLIDPETLRLLRQLPPGRLFDVSRQTVYNIVTEAADQTGLSAKYEQLGYRLSPHGLRHAYATHCYRADIDEIALSHLLGHLVRHTVLYTHPDSATLQRHYREAQCRDLPKNHNEDD